MKRFAAFLAGAAVLALAPTFLASPGASQAEGGVVVLNNGRVFVGKIRKKDDTQDFVVLRWPYKQRRDRSHMKFEHGNAPHNIRWHWRNPDPNKLPDLPTDEYWEKYNDIEKYPIEDKYIPFLQKWLEGRKARESSTDLLVVVDDPLTKGQRLSAILVDGGPFKIQYPEGWRAGIEDNIVIFTSPKPGADGFRARIHAFASKSVQKRKIADQIKEITDQLGRVSENFEVKEKDRLRTLTHGFDQKLLTRTVLKDRPVLALRKIYFRDKYTYFFAAYAHEQDFAALKSLFERVMLSLQIGEEKKKGKKKKKKKKNG